MKDLSKEDSLNLMYYSPTGTTQRIIREIGENCGFKTGVEYDLTRQNSHSTERIINGVTLIGLPVYGGRLPADAIPLLKQFKSNNALAIIVVVYGNRTYGDALLELKNIVHACGFKIIAGAAFIGAHSFSTAEKPIAISRPDQSDLEKCIDFVRHIRLKLATGQHMVLRQVPGNYPYIDYFQLPENKHPQVDVTKCDGSGICAEVCPTGAFKVGDEVVTDGDLCTWCSACVKRCPNEARVFQNDAIDAIRATLFESCSERKEPEFFV